MPIYAYRCAECGHTKDVLRKLSDPPLAVCPACGAEAFQKQVTAAGFQLKGSGWYATDFKNNGAAPAKPADAPAADAAQPADAAAAAGTESPGKTASEPAPAKPAGGSSPPAEKKAAPAAPAPPAAGPAAGR